MNRLVHYLIALMLAFICFPSRCQQPDTTLVRTLHMKAFNFWSTYPDSLLHFRDSSYHVATRIQDKFGIAESFSDLGIYYWVKGDYAKAIQAYDTSNYLFEKINRSDKRISNLSNLGMVYSKLGAYPKAIQYFLESLRLSEQWNYKDRKAKIYNSLGVAYKNQQNYPQAFLAYENALVLFKELKTPENVAGCYSNIGALYALQKDYKRGYQYLKNALHIFDSLKNFRGLVTCYNNISDLAQAEKNYNAALDMRQKALQISKEKGFFSSEVAALSGLGSISLEMKSYNEAEAYFQQALKLAEEKNYRSEIVNLYKGLSGALKGRGKSEEALRYYEQYVTLKDSLFNQQSVNTISNLQTAYDLDKKEASIQLLQKDNQITKLSRNLIMLGAIALLLIAAFIVAWQRTRIKKHHESIQQQAKLHETEKALTQAKLESARIKEEDLRKEIDYKNRSLTTYALTMVQKNEILEDVKEMVEVILKKPDNQSEHFKKLSRIIDYGFTLDKDWEDFRLYFDEVHTDFFNNLRSTYPDISNAELKLSALIRLNLNVKQSAAILRISPDSVKVARHRLRKKLNLQTEDNLTGYIMSL